MCRNLWEYNKNRFFVIINSLAAGVLPNYQEQHTHRSVITKKRELDKESEKKIIREQEGRHCENTSFSSIFVSMKGL